MSRAQKLLNDLVASRTLSPAGLAWLTLAVDPWHDTAVTGLEGMPDQGIGKSVSFQVVQELSISKNTAPVALPAGNWSVRIGNFPKLTPENVSPGFFYGAVVHQDNATANLLQSVAVQYAQDGADFPDVGIASLYPANPQGVSLPIEYTQGVVKVLGVGIEVINTTSSLYKQGLVSYCRMVQPQAETFTSYVSMSTPANSWGIKSMTPIRTLPKNLTEMALYPGFAQTEASEGYYAPVLLKFGKTKSFPVPNTTLLLDDDPTAGPFSIASPLACYSSRNTGVVVPGNATTFYTSNDLPLYYDCDSNVCVFSGLSDQTTLTLRVRFICERFPSDAERQMLVIATPSADYDPIALEIYSKAVQRLPAGVPFSENPAGEWWMKMVEEIANAAAPFLGGIHPALGLAAKGVGAVAGAASNRTKTSRKKKEAKAAGAAPPPVAKPVMSSGVNRIAASPQARKKPLPKPPVKK